MTTLQRATEDIGYWLAKQGVDISQPVSSMVIRRAILETRGTDIKTLEKWIKILTDEGRIKEREQGQWIISF